MEKANRKFNKVSFELRMQSAFCLLFTRSWGFYPTALFSLRIQIVIIYVLMCRQNQVGFSFVSIKKSINRCVSNIYQKESDLFYLPKRSLFVNRDEGFDVEQERMMDR